MSEPKTKMSDANVHDFLSTIDDEIKRQDSSALLDLFTRATGEKAKMWGTSIIGFGLYHYRSGSKEHSWPLAGFSPRKASLTLYLTLGSKSYDSLLKGLGKHKTSVGCLYIKRLADVDLRVLERLIKTSFEAAKQKHNS